MAAGFPAAAEALRGDKTAIAAEAVEAAGARDPELRRRFTDRGMANLLHDAEMITERLAMCLAGGDTRWLPEFVEWMSPILRRRGVAQADLAAVVEAVREIASPRLGPDERELADRALDATVEVLRKNGRVGGDSHKRNALLRWLYRGV